MTAQLRAREEAPIARKREPLLQDGAAELKKTAKRAYKKKA
jgi:hypothetical protein